MLRYFKMSESHANGGAGAGNFVVTLNSETPSPGSPVVSMEPPPSGSICSLRLVSDSMLSNNQNQNQPLSPNSSSSSLPMSERHEQFEDAPEDNCVAADKKAKKRNPGNTIKDSTLIQTPPTQGPSALDALALACAAEKDSARSSPMNTDASANSTPIVSNTFAGASGSKANTEAGSTTASFQISHNDVLCGRGGLTNHHPGNVFFRRMVRLKQEAYLRATKRDKAGVARDIVDTIRKLNPPGRFLKKDPASPGLWVEIGNRKAREKTSQALREGAPELREELEGQSSPQEGSGAGLGFTPDQAQAISSVASAKGSVPTGVLHPTGEPLAVRPRVVSSDSVGGLHPFPAEVYQQQQHESGQGQPHHVEIEQSSSPMDATNYYAPPTSGTKRKLDECRPAPCGLQQMYSSNDSMVSEESCHQGETDSQGSRSPQGPSKRKKAGPRLKMLKARMMDNVTVAH